MAIYGPPVSHLVQLGDPRGDEEWSDYSAYGIGPEHVPELIRLAQDEELAWADPESPVVYGQVHAWRALGQLRAEAAVAPLLDLLAGQEDDEDWNDWITEEVPRVLGMIGPAALPAVVARLERRGTREWAPSYYATALTEIARRHPDSRAEVVRQLCGVLETAAVNEPGVNGCVIGNLLDLKAAEAWLAIERAFATGNVDESVAGDLAEVRWQLGLGPEPPRRPAFAPAPRPVPGGATPKQRAKERARRKKADKRKSRKGK